jgi:hypothetical protein
VTVSPSIVSELQQVLTYIAFRFDRMEQNMATKAELESALSRLQTAVTAKVQDVSDKLTAMKKTLGDFVAADTFEDATYEATIADLRAQLGSDLDAAVAAVDALTASVSGPASA